MPEPTNGPWFAGRPGAFLVFRVNRRPLDDATLFTPPMPPDVFEHFVRVLAPGYQVVTGRRHQRKWRVGGVRVEPDARAVVGKLGWLPRGEEVIAEWSDEEKDWVSSTASLRGGRIMPFGFDGETRLLTVLSDRSSAPPTIAAVFERILRENEAEPVRTVGEHVGGLQDGVEEQPDGDELALVDPPCRGTGASGCAHRPT